MGGIIVSEQNPTLYFNTASGNTTWSDTGSGSGWSLTSGGAYTQPWGAGSRYVANFEGTAGTVNVSGAISRADVLGFNTAGYTLSGGSITLGSTYVNVPSGTATVNSTLIGSGMQMSGTGTLILGGANTFAGTTMISSGTLQLGNTSALQNSILAPSANNAVAFSAGLGTANVAGLGGSGNIVLQDTAAAAVKLAVGGNNSNSTYSGVLSGPGGLAKTGTGTLTVVESQTYTGATAVSGGGTLRVLGVPTSNPVTSGLLYQLDASSSNNYTMSGSQVTSWADLSGNGRNFTGSSGPTLSASTYNGLNALSFATAQSLKLSTATTPETVFLMENVTSHAADYAGIWGNGSADVGVREDVHTSSIWRNASNTNTGDYTGNTGGQMWINGVLQGASPPAGGLQLLEAAATATGSFATTVLNGYSTSNRPMGVDIGEVLAFSSTLTAAQQQQVQSYLMYKWMGTVSSGANGLPSSTDVTISGGSTLDLSGQAAQTIASLNSTDGLGSRVLLGGAALSIGGTASTTFDGVISGSGSLVRQAGGLTTLTGSNIYTGGTTIAGGTLQIGGGGTTGSIGSSSSVSLASGGLLVFNRGDNYGGAFTPAISGGGGLLLSAGSLSLTGANTNSGATTISAGTLNAAAGGLGSTSAISIGSGATFVDGRTNAQVANLVAGSGTWNLSGYGEGSSVPSTLNLSGFAGTMNLPSGARFWNNQGTNQNPGAGATVNVPTGAAYGMATGGNLFRNNEHRRDRLQLRRLRRAALRGRHDGR